MVFRCVLAWLPLLYCPLQLTAQAPNLIPNPSFERYRNLPSEINYGKLCLDSWTVPIQQGRGDYYHELGDIGHRPSDNEYGHEKPLTGQAMTAICTTPNFRECLQTQFTAPLVRDCVYTFIIHVSCADNSSLYGTVSDFGALFVSRPFTNVNMLRPLLQPPNLQWHAANGFSQREGWTTLTADYTARGGETTVLFGVFLWTDSETGKLHGDLSQNTQYAHYYVDDVVMQQRKYRPVTTERPALNFDSAFSNGQSITLRNLLFATGSAILDTNSTTELDLLADYLKRHLEKRIHLTGHTDDQGDAAANQQLSEARARAAMNYLQKKGIATNRMTAEGKGETEPLLPNTTEGGRLLNRRVVVRLTSE